ncbi:hypothetical protein [Limosilactobacillus reuteri]|uniref:hypothetical protein n=1 Tax=Limosilactobacillus reuteri TaxID=1598 RepID=UPI001E46CB02|nr:hypothetical protein [Limosilactobacillus reuteri]MCC4459628.1 hypothetical protein [Limosilactobacillus reuteri]MCC4463497.1 hypothetical protein [Limosilactobacillus reuteri]
MGTMMLVYMIAPMILFLVNIIYGRRNNSWLILNGLLLLLFAGVTFLRVYINLPSRNLLSILISNGFWGIIYELITLSAWNDFSNGDKKWSKLLLGCISVCAGAFIIGCIGEVHSKLSVKPTWQSISKQYSKSSEAPTFKRNETPVALAPNTVLNRVRKSMSDIPNSQYFDTPDTVQAQYYKGKPVYIIPLKYDGFFAMRRAQEIPGYFIVDATNQNAEPKFVKKPYKYATSAYFNHDVDRQIYRNNPEWLTMSKPQLEIDDDGTPYWVQTVYKSETFSHRVNYQQLHVVVMNAQTGSQKTYSIKNLPKFIDEGITSDSAAQMNKVFGKYKHGFWNFSRTDVIKPTNNGPEDGVTSIFNRDGSISYFTDFTNPNSKADSAMGYSMINARTGKLTFYSANGIMDSTGAKENANQNYKAQQWKAKMPVLYNVNGRPTWVMTILDSSHAIRGYYYLDAQDQSIYGSGNNPTSALDAFRQALVNNGATARNTPGTKQKNIQGTVDRSVVVSDKNKVMFTLQGSNTVYTVNTNDYAKANLIRPGDKLEFKASVVKGQSVGNVEDFTNESLR